ncbi:hypothetical protein CXK94_08340 [Stutzerimonas stutzeri]|uniref:EscE/YscE/SsaE family type III secretion system needle protein co-chaperone n=1 Tax=Stutzerimonas stutzeri TaxID=316 RepID=A0A2N8T634_STUST|nr:MULTISPECIES: hypothetical protein [Pseudomonadaceae]MCQ4325758.1 hypothetical protein [Stutzerimonas stutzeri]PNG10188.1 hypothetical protein CXK94_08340 [Stutzerimonas stutzeri]UIP88231.1 hypothetical protein HU825_17435 [Pseudomonas phenolilytica]
MNLQAMDALVARLLQAQAVLSACRAAEGTLAQYEVLNAMWAAQDLLQQALESAGKLQNK